MNVKEIEGVYGSGKKFIIVFKKNNYDIINKIIQYIKIAYTESQKNVINDMQFDEEIIEEMKLNLLELNEIFDMAKMTIMRMFLDSKNPIFNYIHDNISSHTKYEDEYKYAKNCELDNGIEEEYDNCLALYENKYKMQLFLNKIEEVTKKPTKELKYYFPDLEKNLFAKESKLYFGENYINWLVWQIIDYYKVFDEFKYYNVEMNEYYDYLIEYIQNDKIIEWINKMYGYNIDDMNDKVVMESILDRGDLEIAEYFDYLENDVEDLTELNKLKEHLHLYSKIKNSLANKYGLERLKDLLNISNSYEEISGERTLYEYKAKKYYSNSITVNLLILITEINGWNNNLLSEIFDRIINVNLSSFEKMSSSYCLKCFCDENGLKLYNKFVNNNVDLEKYAKELNFSYSLYTQLKSNGIRTFYDLLSLNWQMLTTKTHSLNDNDYRELVSALLNYGIDIRLPNDSDSILILGLPTTIRNLLKESNITEIFQLVNINEYKLADILLNDDERLELLLNRLHKFGITINDKNTKLCY